MAPVCFVLMYGQAATHAAQPLKTMFSNLFTGVGVLGVAYGFILTGAGIIGQFTPCPYTTEAQCHQMRRSAAGLAVNGFLVLSAGAGAFSVGRFAASD